MTLTPTRPRATSDRRFNRALAVVPLLFGLPLLGLVWSGMTLAFDFMMVRQAVEQVRATAYPVATGTIVSSEVDLSSDGDGGESRKADVHFRYRVGGRDHESTTIRFGPAVGGRRTAGETVARYPVDRTVDVYFDPADPFRAILEPGLSGGDLLGLIFVLPFNVIGAVFCVSGVRRVGRHLRPSAAGLPLTVEGATARVRLPRLKPWEAGAIAIALSGFVASFAVAIPAGIWEGGSGQINPPLWAALVAMAAIALVTAAVWAHFRQCVSGPAGDLCVDRARRRVRFPRRPPALNDLADVGFDRVDTVDMTRKTDKSGDDEKVSYVVELRWRDAGGAAVTARLATFLELDQADTFADWLAAELEVLRRDAVEVRNA